MLDHRWVDRFTVENLFNMIIGVVVLGAPWLLLPSFWNALVSLGIVTAVSLNAVTLLAMFGYYYLLASRKYSPATAAFKGLKRIVIVWVAMAVVVGFIIIFFGKVSLGDPAATFAVSILSAEFVAIMTGSAFDMLLSQ
ncbi:hypothetical protein JXB02_00475 [Candidatus Woesearchaeota archaeon]|nr:hypothetical protein [Candidatus Woesearchaeota archaeon]